MIVYLQKLPEYFGPLGMASVAAWLFGAGLLVLFVCGLRKPFLLRLALVAGIAGYVLARYNSDNISAILIDFSAERAAARARAERERPGPDVESDIATRPTSRPASRPTTRYAYRTAGKVHRAAGKKIGDKVLEDYTRQDIVETGRTMPQQDVARANRLDRINLTAAWLTIAVALLAWWLDDLLRFNRTFGGPIPRPLAGRCVDAMSRKKHSVCAHAARDDVWPDYLRRGVRKGETFIHFGPSDPLAGSALPRFRFLGLGLCRLEKITCTPDETHFDADFAFESAWFGRYGFVVTDEPMAREWLDALLTFLATRHATRASVRRTVNILWAFEAPIPRETLTQLIDLCRETNFRLLLSTTKPQVEELADLFEEVHPDLTHA